MTKLYSLSNLEEIYSKHLNSVHTQLINIMKDFDDFNTGFSVESFI